MYVLKLYITAQAPNSLRALANIRRICQEGLDQKHDLEVIDVVAHPELAEAERIIATPTLVKQSPPPTRKLLGDLSDRETVLLELDVVPGAPPGGGREDAARHKAVVEGTEVCP